MPGPDDTMRFLQKIAEEKGYIWPYDLDPEALLALKNEADALRQAERGLGALLKLYLEPQTERGFRMYSRSSRVTTSPEEQARFSTHRGSQ